MNHPTLPMVRSATGYRLLSDILGTFIEFLRATGLSAGRIQCLRREAQRFLIWLGVCDIAIESIDDDVLRSFRHHDCDYPAIEGNRHKVPASNNQNFMSGALKLVQFLEQQGCIFHLGEYEVNLRCLEDFIARCGDEGYCCDTLRRYHSSCRHILMWLHRSRISIADVNTQILERFVHHDCVCPGSFRSLCQHVPGRHYDYPFRSFLQHLEKTGIVSVQSTASENPTDPAMEPFADWLRRHRGIGDKSIRRHCLHVASLVSVLGRDPRSYDAARIRQALLEQYRGVSKNYAQTLAGSMRMYLRYLSANDVCSPLLINAVPAAPSWKLASLPRYIGPEDVEHVITCCDVTKPAGLRDRAILLLLARLALRAGDIVAMRLEDIDWRNALVRVCGKSKRQESLPLPQDAGDAILDYVENARPQSAESHVFLRTRAPYRRLAESGSVTNVVKYALKRAGLEEVRPQGACLFRHSAATNMLRSGKSLEAISTVLRHKSMDTTTIYAKTDKPMLLEVAQPWIGGQS